VNFLISAIPSGVASTFTYFVPECQNGGVAHLDVHPTSILPDFPAAQCQGLHLHHMCHFEGKPFSLPPSQCYGSFLTPQTSMARSSSPTTSLPSLPSGTNYRRSNPHKSYYMGHLWRYTTFTSYAFVLRLTLLHTRPATCS
jgi:hypothetical protein